MVTYSEAKRQNEATLRRWLTWALRTVPERDRILAEMPPGKAGVLSALAWIGAIE